MTRPEPAPPLAVPDIDYRGSTAYLDWLRITETDFTSTPQTKTICPSLPQQRTASPANSRLPEPT